MTHLQQQILEGILLLLLSAFFSSAETALVAVNRIRLRTLAEEGSKRAAKVLTVLEQEQKMLAAILIGNNLVNTSLASLASLIAAGFGGFAVGIATFLITFLLLVFGEITPKTLATTHAEKLSMLYAPVIWVLMTVLTPVIWFVNLFSNAIVRLFGSKAESGPTMTESELRTIVDVSHEEGVIESGEKKLITNVFDFSDVLARDIMVPRVHVVTASLDATRQDLLDLYAKERNTRIPIYKDKPDNIIGFINMKDLLLVQDGDSFSIQTFLRKPYFTVETKKVSDLLVEMRNATYNLAIVLDEYGELSGIVTMEDIVEEIVGEVQDEYDTHEDDNIRQTAENVWIVKGYLNLNDVNEALGLDLDSEDFDSIGGLMIGQLSRLPQLNDEVRMENGIRMQVTALQKNRIEEVKIILPEKKEEDPH